MMDRHPAVEPHDWGSSLVRSEPGRNPEQLIQRSPSCGRSAPSNLRPMPTPACRSNLIEAQHGYGFGGDGQASIQPF
jgi:hypothetical protein